MATGPLFKRPMRPEDVAVIRGPYVPQETIEAVRRAAFEKIQAQAQRDAEQKGRTE